MLNMKALSLMVQKLWAMLTLFKSRPVKGHNQGHMLKIYGTIRKVLS